MMKKNLMIAALAVLAAMVACNKEENIQVTDPDEIQFEIGLPVTRVAGNAFEVGDEISLYAVEYQNNEAQELQIGGNWLNNEKLSRQGNGQWKAAEKLFWAAVPCDFYAVYPYVQPKQIDRHQIDIVTNQNLADGYEKSDLLFAKAEKVDKAAGKVKLQFRHMMSKCVVNVVKGVNFKGELPEDITVHIYNTATSALLNIANGSLQANGLGSRKTITMKKVSKDKHEAVVIPQNIERRTPLIEVTMGGIAYLLEYSLSFKPGYIHTINLTVNTSPDQEKIEISIDASTGQY